jgi:hypothetical protein
MRMTMEGGDRHLKAASADRMKAPSSAKRVREELHGHGAS